jgi:lysozyme
MTTESTNSRKPWLGLVGGSAVAIATLLTSFSEGTVYKAYPDPATHGAPWTICEGHTQGVKKGDTATQAQCDAYLKADMAVAASTVARCILVPVNINQAAALYDAVFNVGPSVVCGSTLQRLANAGDLAGMCAQLARWDRAGGRVWPGLTTRRMNDVELCNYPTQGQPLVYPANWKGVR